MSNRIRDNLFLLCVISLIFSVTPPIFHIRLIGGPFFRQLVIFPLIASILYTVIYYYKNHVQLYDIIPWRKFVFTYVLVLFISLVWGLIEYPYYETIIYGPVDQIERLPKVINLLSSVGVHVSREELIPLWMFLRPFKVILLDTLYTFGGAYIFYNWYRSDSSRGLILLNKGVIISVVICLLYCLIEIPQICGSEFATQILKIINPYIHAIKISHNWWPPLFWKAQLRSVFAEPSFFGTYAAFCVPFLWMSFFTANQRNTKRITFITLLLFNFCIFLTQARTAVLLFWGELFLLIVSIIIIREKGYVKQVLLVSGFSILVFCFSAAFISQFVIPSQNLVNNTEMIAEDEDQEISSDNDENSLNTYVSNNMLSAFSSKKRSNVARFAMIATNLKIGADHPLLGVGYTLRTGYIPDYMTEYGARTVEIHDYLKSIEEDGIMRVTIPMLGEYPARFAETGIFGLVLFLIPPFYLLKLLTKKLKYWRRDINAGIISICLSISLIGLLVAGIFDIINNNYAFWILLGISYAFCYDRVKVRK